MGAGGGGGYACSAFTVLTAFVCSLAELENLPMKKSLRVKKCLQICRSISRRCLFFSRDICVSKVLFTEGGDGERKL